MVMVLVLVLVLVAVAIVALVGAGAFASSRGAWSPLAHVHPAARHRRPGAPLALMHRRSASPLARHDDRPDPVRRILLPFTGSSISRRAFDAAVRLARAEGATLMPCYLATVPLNLPLDAPLPRQCLSAMSLLEVIEQRAVSQGVAIDSRVSRGRTYRDALRRELEEEPFDRVIVSATSHPGAGFSGDDLVWLLSRADAEVLILRPAPEDAREVSAQEAPIAGHF